MPAATVWLQTTGSRKGNRKLSRQQFGLKNLFQTKNSPTKKSYKKSRDKEWSLQKCSQIEKTHLSNPSTEPKARWLWLCTARDCLSEGMQRGQPLAHSRGSSQHPAHHSHTGSHPSEHQLLLCPHPTRAPDPSMGTASRTPSPEGFISTPHLPSAPVAATSLGLGFPPSSLATSHSSNPLCWYQFGGWFQPHHGGGTSTLCRVTADTQEPAFLFLVNGTKTLPQIINSSPKSLYQPLEAFRVWLSGSNHSPRRHPQACVKDYQQWLRPLLHPARKGPFTA